MARSRNIKPSLFKNEILGEADPLLTILFQGLWCLADREGRLENRPKRIKAEIFPYRELPNFNGYLTELEQLGFIASYSVGIEDVIQVLNFVKHQSPHKTEKKSELPERPVLIDSQDLTEVAPLNTESLTEVAALIPDSLIPDSCVSIDTLKTSRKRFSPPSISQVSEYCDQRKNQVDAERFVDFYQGKGWLVGKSKMVDWKAAVRTWEIKSSAGSSNGATEFYI